MRIQEETQQKSTDFTANKVALIKDEEKLLLSSTAGTPYQTAYGYVDVIKKRKEKHNPDGTGSCIEKYLRVSKTFDIMGIAGR